MKRMSFSLPFLLLILTFGLPVGAVEVSLEEEFSTPRGFSLKLPSDWIEIPRDVVDGLGEGIEQVNPNIKRQVYDYGFHRKPSEKRLTYPYILVQVQDVGRVPERQLKKMKTIQKQMNEVGETFEKGFGTLVSSMRSGETIYDPERHVLWSRFSGDLSGVGEVRSLTGTVLTSKGVINIHCYSRGEDFEKYTPTFQAIVQSVSLDKDLKYK